MYTPDTANAPGGAAGGAAGAADAAWKQCRVTLPAPHNWLVLDLTAQQPDVWARSVADEHFTADVPADVPAAWREAFAQDVLWYWVAAARQKSLCAALLTPQDSGVVAFYSVRELNVPPESLRLDVLRAEAERAEGPYFVPQGVTEVELPLGAALRVHRLEPTDPDADSGSVLEGVAHYVLPRAHPTALECRLLWGAVGLGEELGKIADELAASLRLV
ncbi:hypothetical protein [Streptomyces sporangiiformans]|uniref:Uncharacterized protein n=1 Tax=Streptomyces sporangiiformans TaxID=2315329 RepID=A0A505DNG1_9ACTN|nr:hypothetical protein [Streptomyces sporangiiformans]TPQ22071.1 hypothetical protein FGD71_011795 [Streptomyces sporangiiformans]